METSSLLSIVSVCATCTGFFLFLTVLLAANNFLKSGTVGKMSVTFYCLASFNGCMWASYGVLLGSATITMPNAWSILTTTFAIVSYFSVLGKEVAAAKAKASNPITPDSSTTITSIVKIVDDKELISGVGQSNNTVSTDKVGGGLPIGEGSVTKEGVSACGHEETSPAVVAELLSTRYREAKRTLIIVQCANVCTLLVIIFSALFGSNTNTAVSVSGTMGVAVATLLFTGPLDQVSWILKNKNSVPLDPLMTIVGTLNAFMWGVFGLLTHDFFVICPNAVAILLCVLQLGLIVKFPREKVIE